MQPAISFLAVVPMRKEPSHRSEMVSQLLFGETLMAGEEKDDFVFVRCDYDGYEGWVQAKQIWRLDHYFEFITGRYTTAFAAPVTKSGELFHVPYASPYLGGGEFYVAGEMFSYLIQEQQTWDPFKARLNEPVLSALIQPYLNVPYLWGGKSVFGTDCSGFVQQVFKLLGIKLPRDAYQQAGQGTSVGSVAEAGLGDMAFFQNEAGKVTHVGIVLNNGRIVHAAGQVRIDTLTEKGISRHDTSEQTHRFHSIRRYV